MVAPWNQPQFSALTACLSQYITRHILIWALNAHPRMPRSEANGVGWCARSRKSKINNFSSLLWLLLFCCWCQISGAQGFLCFRFYNEIFQYFFFSLPSYFSSIITVVVARTLILLLRPIISSNHSTFQVIECFGWYIRLVQYLLLVHVPWLKKTKRKKDRKQRGKKNQRINIIIENLCWKLKLQRER